MSTGAERPTPDLFEHLTGFRGFRDFGGEMASPFRSAIWRKMVDMDGWATAICGEGAPPGVIYPMMREQQADCRARIEAHEKELAGLQETLREAYALSAKPMPPVAPAEWLPQDVADADLSQVRFISGAIGARVEYGGRLVTAFELEEKIKFVQRTIDELWERYKLIEHKAPGALCACGLYAMHDPTHIPPGIEMRAVALVQAKGVIQVHGAGIRAEKMRVVALAPRRQRNIDALMRAMNRYAYGLPEPSRKDAKETRNTIKWLEKVAKQIPGPKITVVDSAQALVAIAPEFGTPVPDQLMPDERY